MVAEFLKRLFGEPSKPKYTLCSFTYRKKKVIIKGDTSPDSLSFDGEWPRIFVPSEYHEWVRSFTENHSLSGMLNSDRELHDQPNGNGYRVFEVNPMEYEALTKLRKIKNLGMNNTEKLPNSDESKIPHFGGDERHKAHLNTPHLSTLLNVKRSQFYRQPHINKSDLIKSA